MKLPRLTFSRTLADLRGRLADAEETLRAIRGGEVDSVVVTGDQGPRVFTLEGVGQSYRVLIESMNEGALTLTADKLILYANQCFARMVGFPLEQVIGSSFRRLLSAGDLAMLRPLLKRPRKSGSKIQVMLNTAAGARLPVQISIRPLVRDGHSSATIGMVVTDMTEARRTEELLRALSHRLVQAQEAERGRIALELHDHITQLLCGLLVRSQVLADKLPAGNVPAKQEAMKLSELLGETAAEVERISRNLRPGVLDQLGLVAVLREAATGFAKRTGIPVKLTCVSLPARLPPDIELSLYRILQEALKNIGKHARARHVTVTLSKSAGIVQLAIKDDGTGFDPSQLPAGKKENPRLGLLGMRERATYVGGTLQIKSTRRTGTEIAIQIPLPPPRPKNPQSISQSL